MFSTIKKVKILLDNQNIFTQPQGDYKVNSLENIYNEISYCSLNIHQGQAINYSLIIDNPFGEYFDSIIIPTIKFIKDLTNGNNTITLYVNNYTGSQEQYEALSENNVELFILNNSEKLFTNEEINLILNYFPLTYFNFYLQDDNCSFYNIWNYYKDYNIYNLNILPSLEKEYSKEFFQNLDNQLNEVDKYLISAFEDKKEVPVIPEVYRYMFWKIGVKDYLSIQKILKCIPEAHTGVRCGEGCSKQLIINCEGNIKTCCYSCDDRFTIGDAIAREVETEKIESILTDSLEESGYNKLTQTKCSQCELHYTCLQGCSPINYNFTNKLFEPTDSYCSWQQIIFNHAKDMIIHFELYKNCELFKNYYLGSIIKGENYYVC